MTATTLAAALARMEAGIGALETAAKKIEGRGKRHRPAEPDLFATLAPPANEAGEKLATLDPADISARLDRAIGQIEKVLRG